MSGDSIQMPEPQKVIVVERRSLLADFAGIWLVAIPVLVAFLVCLPQKDQPESPRSELNLPASGWSQPPLVQSTNAGSRAEDSADTALSSDNAAANPLKKTRIEIANEPDDKLATVEAARNFTDGRKADTGETAPIPKGVMVLNNSINNLNPVAVFDPRQKGTGQPAIVNSAAGKSVKDVAALNEPHDMPDIKGKNETAQALAEIQIAADAAKTAKQTDEAIKPLLALHDAEKTKMKSAELKESLRQRAQRNQRPFLSTLATIISNQATATERSAAIQKLMDDDLDGVDPRHFQQFLSELDSPGLKLSSASKIRRLRGFFVPESVILAYLTELEKRDSGKSRGSARNTSEAIVQASRLLLRNSADLLR